MSPVIRAAWRTRWIGCGANEVFSRAWCFLMLLGAVHTVVSTSNLAHSHRVELTDPLAVTVVFFRGRVLSDLNGDGLVPLVGLEL